MAKTVDKEKKKYLVSDIVCVLVGGGCTTDYGLHAKKYSSNAFSQTPYGTVL